MSKYFSNTTYITERPIFFDDRNAMMKKAESYGLVLSKNQRNHPELLAQAIRDHEQQLAEYSKVIYTTPNLVKENAKKLLNNEIWGIYELELLEKADFFNIYVDPIDINWHELESAINFCETVVKLADDYNIPWEPYVVEIRELNEKIDQYEIKELKENNSIFSQYKYSISMSEL